MADLHELGARRAELLHELDELQQQIRPAAVAAVHNGDPKLYVAKDAGVTRPTLDKWIVDAYFDDVLAGMGRGFVTLRTDELRALPGDPAESARRVANERGLTLYLTITDDETSRLQWHPAGESLTD